MTTGSLSPAISAQDLVDRAKRDLAVQEGHLASLREQVINAEAQVERLRGFLNTAAAYLNDPKVAVGPTTDKPPTQAEVVLAAAEDAIKQAGRPLTVRELYTHMLQQGHRIGGKDPKNNLSWMLSNPGKGRLKYEQGQGWAIDNAKKNGSDAAASDPLL